ncbi:hypothetical protein Tco_1207812 [Tanacetum coccineum]
MLCVMNSTAVFGDPVNLEMQSSDSCDKCFDLDAELLEKQNAYNELLRSYSQLEKHCIYLELTMQLNQEIFQKDKSWNNQNALEILEYSVNNDLKAQLQAKDTTIRMFKLNLDPLAPRRNLELLVYVRDTCPNANKPSEKLVAVTPLNKVKKVRFSKPLTSSSNIHKHVESSKTPDSNTHVLPSTGLKSSTIASRSQHTRNIKNDRISQTPSSNMKNKVEV